MDTREAIHNALTHGERGHTASAEYCDYLCKIDKSGYVDSSGRIASGLNAGHILNAIDAQAKPVGAWLKYCYGHGNKTLAGVLTSYLRFSIAPISNPKKHERLLALCGMAIDDYKLSQMNGRQIPIESYVHAMGVNAPHFARDWGKLKKSCLDLIRMMDLEGVAGVSVMVRSLEGKLEIDGRKVGPTEAIRYCISRHIL